MSADREQTDDPCELIADAIVADLRTKTNWTIKPAAIDKPEDPEEAMHREAAGVRLLVIPSGDEETKIGREGRSAMERFAVAVVVVAKLDGTLTRAKLAGLARQAATYLRGRRQLGYVYSRGETNTKFNPELLHDRKVYVNSRILSYLGTG